MGSSNVDLLNEVYGCLSRTTRSLPARNPDCLLLPLTDAPSHAHSRNVSSTDHLHISSSFHSRSRSNFGGDRPPLSPLIPKRMAKLTRTLGENIPPELVSGTYEPRQFLPEGTSITDFDPPSSDETLIQIDKLSAPLPENKIPARASCCSASLQASCPLVLQRAGGIAARWAGRASGTIQIARRS
ncbi:hypothetical protein BDZ89DRAFT_96658 [Hymenopellis radicata]|nr:hypothetical protein BDZ89DRAFT_96658 [Hymenopellis radicata]